MRTPHRLFALTALMTALTLSGCSKEGGHGDEGKGAHGAKAAPAAKADDKGEEKAADKPAEPEKPADPPKPKGPTKDEIRRARATAPDNVAKAPAAAKKSKKGIPYVVLAEGKGTYKASGDDMVVVRYAAWHADGKRSSTTWQIKTQEPRTLMFRKMIPGWQDILGDMVVGERRLAWIPGPLAHLKRGKKKGQRTVDFELMAVKPAPKPPADLRKPPKDAKKTASGLVYKKLTAGTGKEHPKATTRVKVNYAGWSQQDKNCFDFSEKGKPATFKLDEVIKGWTEGMQLMVAGDKFRFWVPQKIAYDGFPRKPKGTLVFDIELVEVLKDK